MSVYMRDLNLMIYGRSSSCSSLYASTSSLVRRVEGLDNLTLGSEKEKRKKKNISLLAYTLYFQVCFNTILDSCYPRSTVLDTLLTHIRYFRHATSLEVVLQKPRLSKTFSSGGQMRF